MSQVRHRLAAHFYAASNDGMHPTHKGAAPIINGSSGRGMPGVGRFVLATRESVGW